MIGKIGRWSQRRKEKNQLIELVLQNKEACSQFLDYLGNLTNLPAVHVLKQNNIHAYRKEYGFTVLIETGTYLGDMVQAQLNYFKKIISIELSEELHRNAVKRFEKHPQVEILQGDSGAVLKELVSKINEPVLFWLDGHYSAGVTAKGDKETPVLEELRTILGSPYEHGILIDDARLFVGKDDYPTIDELSAFVNELSPDRMITVADDMIRIFKRKAS